MATQQWVAIRRSRLRFLGDWACCLLEEGPAVPPPPRRQPNRDPSGPPRQDRRPARAERPAGTEHGGRRDRSGQPGAEPRRPRFAEPPIADDVDYRELDRAARAGLRSLPKDLAEK